MLIIHSICLDFFYKTHYLSVNVMKWRHLFFSRTCWVQRAARWALLSVSFTYSDKRSLHSQLIVRKMDFYHEMLSGGQGRAVVDLCFCLLASLRLKHSMLTRGCFWTEGPWLLHSLFLAAWQSPSLATFVSEMQQASLISAIALSLCF